MLPKLKYQFYLCQVCRNINQIKICMETGRTVILLNLENLYESLYDVLNQYYIYLGDSRYVDLGLQTHRVKCRVNDNFKYIEDTFCILFLFYFILFYFHQSSPCLFLPTSYQVDCDSRKKDCLREVSNPTHQPSGEALCPHLLSTHRVAAEGAAPLPELDTPVLQCHWNIRVRDLYF